MTASDFERFDDGAYRAVVLAERVARDAGRTLAGPEDLLVALAQSNLEVAALLTGAGSSPDALAARVAEWEGTVGAPVAQAHFSPSLHRAIQRANRFAAQERRSSVTSVHLLRGLLDGEDEVVWRILLSLDLDPAALVPASSSAAAPAPRAATARRQRGAWSVLTAVWRT